MRKLILIAAIATMWTSSCHANLSLASADATAQISDTSASTTEQPKAQAPENRPAPVVKHSVAAKPRKRQLPANTYPARVFYHHCL